MQIGPVVAADPSRNIYGLDAKAGTIATLRLGDDELEIRFPAGCSRLHLQARQAGDIYAEVSAMGRAVSGTGDTAHSAITAALGKLAVAV